MFKKRSLSRLNIPGGRGHRGRLPWGATQTPGEAVKGVRYNSFICFNNYLQHDCGCGDVWRERCCACPDASREHRFCSCVDVFWLRKCVGRLRVKVYGCILVPPLVGPALLSLESQEGAGCSRNWVVVLYPTATTPLQLRGCWFCHTTPCLYVLRWLCRHANWALESRCSFPWIWSISCSIVITASLLLARISEKVLEVSNEFLLESSAHKLLIMVISWLLERLSNSSSSVGSDWTGASSAGGWCWANSTSSVIPARLFSDAIWSRSRCFHTGR